MGLFHRDDDGRRQHLALIIAMAAHVERNIPQIFTSATTDRLEDAADELLGDDELSFETVTVVRRALQGINARNPQRPWANALIEALEAIEEED